MLSEDDEDVQIVSVIKTNKKKEMNWVSSSFGDFGYAASTPSEKQKVCSNSQYPIKSGNEVQSRKRPREVIPRVRKHSSSPLHLSAQSTSNEELWSEKYKPKNRADLAIHKKKVDEVAEWLQENAHRSQKKKAPILLITGPPGSGKAVCLHLLCQELCFSVQEWSNNSELTADQFSNDDFYRSERSAVDTYWSQSQSALFNNFLLRANKYQALDLFSSSVDTSQHDQNRKTKKTVIIVKDIPNIFLREPAQFHIILRKYHSTGRSPLAVIMSESNNNSASIQKLFPKDLQHQLGVTNICFNPVAPTILTKVLNKIITKEVMQGMLKQPSASVIETIAMSSGGDMRSALNALQFACRLDTTDLASYCHTTSTSKRKTKTPGTKLNVKAPKASDSKMCESSDVLAIGAKDKSVFLFHTIGKILYFKRTEPNTADTCRRLPAHLKSHERDPLSVNPEEIVSQSHASADYFNSFLHENYVEFMTSVEDLERASQYFSDADYLTAMWMAREELQNYALSVATRGYIHSNTDVCRHDSVRKNQGWKPMHKSQWFNVSKQTSENLNSARQLFRGYHWEPEVLCTEIIPYIGLTNPTLHDTGQIRIVQELTQFTRANNFIRPKLEKLDEKDVIPEEDEPSEVLESQNPDLEKKTFSNDASQEDDDDENVTGSQTSVQNVQRDEEELIIEEFDDD